MTCAGVMFSQPRTCFSYAASADASLFLHAAKKFAKMHEPDFGGSSVGSPVTIVKEPSTPPLGPKAEVVSHATDAQYISANCVLFTYYSGDISSVVDEHFSRALSQPNSYTNDGGDKNHSNKDSSPMSQRNFPPSFWNSNYQATTTSTLSHAELAYSCDPYHAASAGALHGLHHQGDPWHYSLSTQASYSHRQMHDLAAYSASMPASSRFNPQYSSLLLQPSVRPSRLPPVPGQCPPLSKADGWTAAPRYHESLGPAELAHLDSNYAGGHTYPAMGNMTVTTMTGHKNALWQSARRQPTWQ